MAQTDKWVTDLVTELEKKEKKDLEPTYIPASGGSNLIEPTLEEALAMVTQFRAGKTPPEIQKIVSRGFKTFSLEQLTKAQKAWQTVLNAKTVDVVNV